ncbi:HGL009Cp [Eremothecium sinecaudum]|uniref:HGL009Cp n=1 Tax=Eremothecium sinecaudum TaxID=45286 RepID=A0A0X8HV66_9SACH|nr:HGL009Cp [Eremothecium sinecaudum]AMD22331.1 HGL009Cp [Eremothecium sinecaudum]
MKTLKDLIIPRKELQHWSDNLAWSNDGCFYFTTVPVMTICEPLYEKQVNNQAKKLFHIKEYPLKIDNKFEFSLPDVNCLVNSQPESNIVLCMPSPNSNLLAVLTNNGNLILFEGERLIGIPDEPERGFSERSYRSVCWSPDGKYVAVGNESSEVVIFSIVRNGVAIDIQFLRRIRLCNSIGWVLGITWKDRYIACYTNENIVYGFTGIDFSVQKLLSGSSHQITDMKIVANNVLIVRMGTFYKIDLESGKSSSINLGFGTFYIVPLPDLQSVILVSNKKSCSVSLNEPLGVHTDDILSPIIEGKLKKWNDVFNEFNKYETTFDIYGLAISPDGYSLAILYEIERVSFKYRILSELQYRLMLLPLSENWMLTSNCTGLARYQSYHIYNRTLPRNFNDCDRFVADFRLDFRSFLLKLNRCDKANALRFKNFIEDSPSSEWFMSNLFEYAIANLSKFDNPIDKACVVSLGNILNKEIPLSSEIIEFSGEFITEKFDFKKNKDPLSIESEDGNVWARCFVSFLPLITTKVKVCTVSDKRMIDINRDILNDYGWFTRTLLEVFNSESLYTGTKLIAI